MGDIIEATPPTAKVVARTLVEVRYELERAERELEEAKTHTETLRQRLQLIGKTLEGHGLGTYLVKTRVCSRFVVVRELDECNGLTVEIHEFEEE